MMQAMGFVMPTQATFGRDGAMFESLLGFVAQLSLGLWLVVTLTVVVRFVGIRFYRRAARRALVGRGMPSAPVPKDSMPDAPVAQPGPSTAALPVVSAAGPPAPGHDIALESASTPIAPAVPVTPVVQSGRQGAEDLVGLPAARAAAERSVIAHRRQQRSASAQLPVLASNSTER